MASLRAILRGEELEPRWNPVQYRWNQDIFSTNDNWNNGLNWEEYSERLGKWLPCIRTEYPGSGGAMNDDAIFDSKDTSDCIVNVPNLTIHKLDVRLGYTGTIQLKNSITLSGETIVDSNGTKHSSSFWFGAAAKIAGFTENGQLTRGALTLKPGTMGTWQEGTLQDVTVEIKRDAADTANFHLTPRFNAPPPTMTSTVFDVSGNFYWAFGSVRVGSSDPGLPYSVIRIKSSGDFSIGPLTAGETWGLPVMGANPNPDLLKVVNEAGGKVTLDSDGPVSIVGSYLSAGMTLLQRGSVSIAGTAEQEAGLLQLHHNTTLTTFRLGIRDGTLIGNGTINGHLDVGFDPGLGTYRETLPTVQPGEFGSKSTGRLTVTGHASFFNINLEIEIDDPATGKVDSLAVGGAPALANSRGGTRKVTAFLLEAHAAIANTTEIPFLTYVAPRTGDFAQRLAVDMSVNPPATWAVQYGQAEGAGDNPKKYWVRPLQAVQEKKAKLGGLLWNDANGAIAGVYEPGLEAVFAGVPVRLFNETGTTQLRSGITGADGRYEFADLAGGIYVVEFDRPGGRRFAAQDVGADAYDSDPDILTGRARVETHGDKLDVYAGYFDNSIPLAANDTAATVRDRPVTISVLSNDTDANGDTLSVVSVTQGAYGSVTFTSTGVIYTPNPGWTGTDTFTYTVSDGWGGVSTATVTVTVHAPAMISGSLWLDTNHDGLQTGESLDTTPVVVSLFDGSGYLVDRVTAVNGSYSFTGLPPDSYQVRVAVPAGRTVSPKDVGADDAIDNDFDSYGHSAVFILAAGASLDLDIGWW